MKAAQIAEPRHPLGLKAPQTKTTSRRASDLNREPLGRNLFFPIRMAIPDSSGDSQAVHSRKTSEAQSLDRILDPSPERPTAVVGMGIFNSIKPPHLKPPTLNPQRKTSLRLPQRTKKLADLDSDAPGPGDYQQPSDFDTIQRVVYGVGKRNGNAPVVITKPMISSAPRFSFAKPEVKIRRKAKKVLEETKKAPGPGTYVIPSSFDKFAQKWMMKVKDKRAENERPTPVPTTAGPKSPPLEKTDDSGNKARDETVESGPLVVNKKSIPKEWPLKSPPTVALKRSKSSDHDLVIYEPINKEEMCLNKSALPEVITVPVPVPVQPCIVEVIPAVQPESKDTVRGELISKPAITEAQLKARIGRFPTLFIFFCILFSLALLIGGIFYIAFGYTAAFDKKGKEAYFDQDHTERTLQKAVEIRATHPSWTMRTDDWGFIQRAYEEHKSGSNTRWNNYDVHNEMCIVCIVCGLIWIIANTLEVIKFVYMKWRFTLWCLILNVIALVIFAILNYFILTKLNDFNSSTKKLWTYCNCAKFKGQYYTSIMLYVYTAVFVGCIAAIQLVLSSIFCHWIPYVLNH